MSDTQPTEIAMVIVTTTNDETKEVVKNHYFFQDGKWWQVIDPEKKMPDYPDLIDIRDDVKPRNYKPTPDDVAETLNLRFFPTDWSLAWHEFKETSRAQLQILMVLAIEASGGGDMFQLIHAVHKDMRGGKSIESIFTDRKDLIVPVLIGIAVGPAAELGGKYFRQLSDKMPAWADFITHTSKKSDDVLEFTVNPNFRKRVMPDGELRGGVSGKLIGTVKKNDGVLEVRSPDMWLNTTDLGGLASDVRKRWEERLKDFARENGVDKVKYVSEGLTVEGEKMLTKLNFKRIKEVNENGMSEWEKIVDVD